jgi:hypothetical protein
MPRYMREASRLWLHVVGEGKKSLRRNVDILEYELGKFGKFSSFVSRYHKKLASLLSFDPLADDKIISRLGLGRVEGAVSKFDQGLGRQTELDSTGSGLQSRQS